MCHVFFVPRKERRLLNTKLVEVLNIKIDKLEAGILYVQLTCQEEDVRILLLFKSRRSMMFTTSKDEKEGGLQKDTASTLLYILAPTSYI